MALFRKIELDRECVTQADGLEDSPQLVIAIWAFVKKYRKPAPLTEVGPMELDDPELEKYKDQIEKDLAKLE